MKTKIKSQKSKVGPLLLLLAFVFLLLDSPAAFAAHGFALYGSLKYPKGFKHFDWVNPNAPKQGVIKMASFTPVDSLNPYILNGNTPAKLSLLNDPLMKPSQDEPYSIYGLIAEDIKVEKDRVIFTLNPKARFNDGKQITAEDVLFSFNILREKGLPMFRYYYAQVKEAKILSERKIAFIVNTAENREMPLILGQLSVLPAHYYKAETFGEASLDIPVGSGPYKVSKVSAGRGVTLERVKDYWAKDLNVNIGYYNFDEIQIDVYRDTGVAMEAVKAGLLDYRYENEAKKWVLGYPERLAGLKKVYFNNQLPNGMQGYVFNIRRPKFQNKNVRRAITLAFDFEWTNKNLFYGLYKRTTSYFDNSELGTKNRPPLSAGSANGSNRENLKEALKILEGEGYKLENGILKDKDGMPLAFEILLDGSGGAVWERVSVPFTQNLRKIGIIAKVRTVEANQYKTLTDNYNYDMITDIIGQSLSPGNEQRYYWGSAAADQKGGRNSVGIKSKKIDALIEKLVASKTKTQLIENTRALDEALLWEYYFIPHWHAPHRRYVIWEHIKYPEKTPMLGEDTDTWWTIKKK